MDKMDASEEKPGTERFLGFDGNGYERRERVGAIVKCPICGDEVELIQYTEAWTQTDDGRWEHEEYGPSVGECCDRFIMDYWEGCFVYDLTESYGLGGAGSDGSEKAE